MNFLMHIKKAEKTWTDWYGSILYADERAWQNDIFSKGSEENMKITTLEDLKIFKALLHTKEDAWLK